MKGLATTLLLLLGLSMSSLGQTVLQNKQSGAHKMAGSSKVFLVPPVDFVNAGNFPGFQQIETNSSIVVAEIPAPYTMMVNGMTKEALATRGVEWIGSEKYLVNGDSVALISGKQSAHGSVFGKYLLLTGGAKETILLTASYPVEKVDLGADIKKSLLTLFIDSKLVLDPWSAVDFTIDVSLAGLKVARNMAGSLLFTTDGEIGPASKSAVLLTAGKSISDVRTDNLKEYALNRLKQYPMEVDSIDYIEKVTIDGLPGYEILAKVRDSKPGGREWLYQVMLFSGDSYYILVGNLPGSQKNEVAALRKAVLTFARKK